MSTEHLPLPGGASRARTGGAGGSSDLSQQWPLPLEVQPRQANPMDAQRLVGGNEEKKEDEEEEKMSNTYG
jgi:hypothetical protein